jgi:uncharacterized protein
MAAVPKVIKHFNVTVDGVGYCGLATSVTLPELTILTEEHRAGGMDAPIALDMGMELMTLSFELAEQEPNILAKFGLYNQNAVRLIFRGAQRNDTQEQAYVVTAQGMVTSINLGDISPGEKNTITVNMALRYFKLTIDNRVIYDIDVDNMIRIIYGVDQLEGQRKLIGLNSIQTIQNIGTNLINLTGF